MQSRLHLLIVGQSVLHRATRRTTLQCFNYEARPFRGQSRRHCYTTEVDAKTGEPRGSDHVHGYQRDIIDSETRYSGITTYFALRDTSTCKSTTATTPIVDTQVDLRTELTYTSLVHSIVSGSNESDRLSSGSASTLIDHVRWQKFITPNAALARYLDYGSNSVEKEQFWEHVKHRLEWRGLPSIVLHRLNGLDCIYEASVLANRNIPTTDVDKWCKIVLEEDADERVRLYLSTLTEFHSFLLLEICRRHIMQITTLRSLFIHIWEKVLGRPPPSTYIPSTLLDNPTSAVQQPDLSHRISPTEVSPTSAMSKDLDLTAFAALTFRLLRQCRRIWPEAVVTVAQMVAAYVNNLQVDTADDLNPKLYQLLCIFQNRMLRELVRPASIRPYQTMTYNWKAQMVILDFGSRFMSPLILDRSGYQAVLRVLMAMKKTPEESISAARRTQSWPPWRIDLDGMDARRDRETDRSRVALALEAKRAAGYPDTPSERAMGILGGQEPDGTPTIHTRQIHQFRSDSHLLNLDNSPLSCKIWAERIRATRDTHEAWSAFAKFLQQGGIASASMYQAMFEKLIYERKLIRSNSKETTRPGDGLEVIRVVEDNLTDFYKSSLRPPPIPELYAHMLRRGLRPLGKFLALLVSHATTFEEGLKYIRDATDDRRLADLKFLFINEPTLEQKPEIFKQIKERKIKLPRDKIFAQYMALLCRFTSRAVLVHKGQTMGLASLKSMHPDLVWVLRRSSGPSSDPNYFDNHLLQAVWLLEAFKPQERVIWYRLWRALAQVDLVIDNHFTGNLEECQTAWTLTTSTLKQFREIGLELDPDGFQYICDVFTKFASVAPPWTTDTMTEGTQLLKTEFRKLTTAGNPTAMFLPTFRHLMNGAFLHAYVRSMASIQDYDEIMSTLEWMVIHQDELEEKALELKGSLRLFRRTLVAIRAAFENTPYATKAEVLMSLHAGWIEWPKDEDVEEYRARSTTAYLLDHYVATSGKVDVPNASEESENSENVGSDVFLKDSGPRALSPSISFRDSSKNGHGEEVCGHDLDEQDIQELLYSRGV